MIIAIISPYIDSTLIRLEAHALSLSNSSSLHVWESWWVPHKESAAGGICTDEAPACLCPLQAKAEWGAFSTFPALDLTVWMVFHKGQRGRRCACGLAEHCTRHRPVFNNKPFLTSGVTGPVWLPAAGTGALTHRLHLYKPQGAGRMCSLRHSRWMNLHFFLSFLLSHTFIWIISLLLMPLNLGEIHFPYE